MSHSGFHRFLQFRIVHRHVLLVSFLEGSEDVTLDLVWRQYIPSAGSPLPHQRLRGALPTGVPTLDDRLATADFETTSERAEGVATYARTILPKDLILEGGSVFCHGVAEGHTEEAKGGKNEGNAITGKK